MHSPVGDLTISEEEGKLVSLDWGWGKDQLETPLLVKAKNELEEYFDGTRKIFDLPLNPPGTMSKPTDTAHFQLDGPIHPLDSGLSRTCRIVRSTYRQVEPIRSHASSQPIWRSINRQLSWLTFKDIYGGAFFGIVNTWNDGGFPVQGYKRTAGYELRLNMGSFYAYPTTISFTGAYGLDSVVFVNPLFPENSILNEPRWLYYFAMGFTF